ncbi:hypothetical protein WAK64_20650 [Bacillus spongiae]|uniref:Spore coat protein U domain-containing protein n=1 Tax=Bacillus spongiae TaxID=2683610 RepID=A0ABU8HJH4_9BACI
MKKIIMSFLVLLLMVTGSNIASASKTSKFIDSKDTSSLTATTLLFSSAPNICIGGTRCGGPSKYYQVNLQEQKYIERVTVYAHDNIGDWTKAHLEAYVDGQYIGALPVYKSGSFLTFNVGKYGSNVRFYSVHESGHNNGDETQILTVDVYGY